MTGDEDMQRQEIVTAGAELVARVDAIKYRTNAMLGNRRGDEVPAITNELLSFDDTLFMQADIVAAIDMLQIASLLVPTGQYDPVEQIFLKTIRIVAAHEQRTVFMWFHAVNNLAALYHEKGDYAARDRVNSEIVALAQQLTAPLDVPTAQIFATLASMYERAGHARPAAILYAHLYRFVMATPRLPADSRVNVMRSYGDALTADGHPETALEMYRQSLAASVAALEFTYRDRMSILVLMSRAAQQTNDLAQAEMSLARARDIAVGSDLKDTTEAGAVYHNLATLYLQRKKRECYDEAEGLLEHARDIVAKSGRRDSAEYAGGLAQLAVLVDAKGQHDRADAFFREAFALYESASDTNPKEFASFLLDAGHMYLQVGRDADAMKVFQRSWELQQSTADLGASTLVNTMSGLATAHFGRGEFVHAIRWYRQAIDLRQFGLAGWAPQPASQSLTHTGANML